MYDYNGNLRTFYEENDYFIFEEIKIFSIQRLFIKHKKTKKFLILSIGSILVYDGEEYKITGHNAYFVFNNDTCWPTSLAEMCKIFDEDKIDFNEKYMKNVMPGSF